ncbi:MAG: hemolysin family protein [Pseudomonadota bacterium]
MNTEARPGFLERLRGRLGGGRTATNQDFEKEILELVDQGEARGLISHREGEMIDAVLELGETTAGQIMVPRTEMATVPASAGMGAIIEVLVQTGHSRIPVYQDHLDHIVGVIHAKDLLPFCAHHESQVDLAQIYRRPMFVPQSMPVNQLLSAFKRSRSHLAIVVDEYGGTAGVVTMEDVLEEIVGDISDEYDQEEELISEQADGSLLVSGRLGVEELSQRLDIELPEELPEGRFETVAGFITTYLGRVPKLQEEVVYGPVRLVVTDADERRVTQVLVSLLAGQPTPTE